MMESAGQLLLSAPPLQLPLMVNATSATPSTICCFLPKIEAENAQQGPKSQENEMEIENVSASPVGQEMKNAEEIVGENVAQTTTAAECAEENGSRMETASIKSEVLSMPASNSLPAVIKPPGDEKEERPSLSYKDLIIEAIESSPERRLKLSEIYQVIKYLHPYYQRRADQWGWQNSIRHNLSLHDCFVKLPLKQTSANGVVGHFWTVVHRNPEEKPGPTRRRSRANIGGGNANGGGKGGKKGVHHGLGQSQLNAASAGGKAAKGLKGRQSVSSDSGVMSDDGGMGGGCHSGTQSPMAGGGSASVPLPTLLQIPLQNEPQTMMGKFQPLQSPLAMSSHTPTTLHQFAFQSQAQQNLLSPLELVLNGQNAANLVQSPQQPPLTQIGGQSQFQYSPIPGKTAPAHPQTTLLEQQLQQLLAANATNAAAQMMGPASSSPPHQPQPTTPASAPPTFLGAQSAGHHHPLALMASSLGGTAANDANLSLLSQLASQLLATTSSTNNPSTAALPLGSPFMPPQTQQQQNNNSLAIAAAAAAAELQRLQMLQLYAQQQQQQLQQQLALLEQNHRDQLLLRLGAAGAPHSTAAAVHSAPLSPTTIHSADQTDQSSAVLTQILLSKLLGTSNNAVELPLQTPLPSLAPTTKTSPPPTPAQTQIPSLPSQFVAQQQMAAAELAEATALLLGSSEGGISGVEGGSREAMGAADLALQQLGPLLLQQLHQQRQQQQREEENAPITTIAQQQQMAAAAAQIVQAVQQQQIQQALVVVENSEPELAVV